MNDAKHHLHRLIAIGGPTGIGKTSLGIALAHALNGEIVSADSVQLFQGFCIGAATPSMEERQGIRHHLLGVLPPQQAITAADFAHMADAAIHEIHARGKVPIVVGGSGLYLRALFYGLIDAPPRDDALRATLEQRADEFGDEALWHDLHKVDAHTANALHPNDRIRVIRALEVQQLTGKSIRTWQETHQFQQPKYDIAGIGLTAPRSFIHERIQQRCHHMFDQGLIQEVQTLLVSGIEPSAQPFTAIGYKEVLHYLQAIEDDPQAQTAARAQLEKDMATHTRRFARRQLVWFRKEPSFQWFNAQDGDNILKTIIPAARRFLATGVWQGGAKSEREVAE